MLQTQRWKKRLQLLLGGKSSGHLTSSPVCDATLRCFSSPTCSHVGRNQILARVEAPHAQTVNVRDSPHTQQQLFHGGDVNVLRGACRQHGGRTVATSTVIIKLKISHRKVSCFVFTFHQYPENILCDGKCCSNNKHREQEGADRICYLVFRLWTTEVQTNKKISIAATTHFSSSNIFISASIQSLPNRQPGQGAFWSVEPRVKAALAWTNTKLAVQVLLCAAKSAKWQTRCQASLQHADNLCFAGGPACKIK